MEQKFLIEEIKELNKDIIEHKEYNKLKDALHHGISRYEHSLRVAYYTYKVTKFLRLNYKEATKAALLHDFFIDEVEEMNSVSKLRKHPEYAVENSKKYFELTALEEDIISTHMFPVTFRPPKFLESWIVDILDDVAALYERFTTVKSELATASMFISILLINISKYR